MNLRLPVLSDGSDHGTTSTRSSAEHSTDHSESITNYLSVTEGEAAEEGRLRREPEESAAMYVRPSSRRTRTPRPAERESRSGPHAEFAGQLEYQVPPHRIADQRHRSQAVPLDEKVHHHQHVVREARMVESGRKRLRAAAVPHIHADNVAARAPQLVRVADDILRLRRAFEPMHDDRGGPRCTNLLRLPVAVAEDLARNLVCGRGRHLDQLCFRRRKAVDPRQIVAGDGLQMSVVQKTPWTKIFDVTLHSFDLYCGHQHPPALARSRNAVALSAPVGSSSCLKYT